jgi:hypothetical protein
MTNENSIAPAISESDVRRLAELTQILETSIGRLCEFLAGKFWRYVRERMAA